MDDEGRVLHAQIPTSFGPELRACLRCRLVKTYDQVPSSAAASFPVWFNHGISQGKSALCRIGGLVHRQQSRSRGLFSAVPLNRSISCLGLVWFFFGGQAMSPMDVMLFPLPPLWLLFDARVQFRENGCENCPFLEMERENDNVVNCTTPNFTG
jgi:hypothetical protein